MSGPGAGARSDLIGFVERAVSVGEAVRTVRPLVKPSVGARGAAANRDAASLPVAARVFRLFASLLVFISVVVYGEMHGGNAWVLCTRLIWSDLNGLSHPCPHVLDNVVGTCAGSVSFLQAVIAAPTVNYIGGDGGRGTRSSRCRFQEYTRRVVLGGRDYICTGHVCAGSDLI